MYQVYTQHFISQLRSVCHKPFKFLKNITCYDAKFQLNKAKKWGQKSLKGVDGWYNYVYVEYESLV